jgi:hypothetical protein
MRIGTALIVSFGLTLSVSVAQAATNQPKSDIVVEPSAALPDPTQEASQDMFLHFDGAGIPYLYLEQQQGERLIIVDVSDPARLKVVASVATGVHKPYDFAGAIEDIYQQILFRDGSGGALLSLQSAKAPKIIHIQSSLAVPIHPLGHSGYLAEVTDPMSEPASPPGQTYQVMDAPTASQPLASFTDVTRIIRRPDTGTVFLLGKHGLIVIRCLTSEQRHVAEEAVLRHN